MTIAKDFSGANIEVAAIYGDKVYIRPELRDTYSNWFYWAFCVKNAANKTIVFDFSSNSYIGYFGAAVSHDLKSWKWSGGVSNNRESFEYTFANDENCVYFAHHMLYGMERFNEFAMNKGIAINKLCVDNKGTDVPYITIGNGLNIIMLTARHHCCESTGNYVLEGVIDELCDNLPYGYKVIAIPFVDADGVVNGDQGKNRIPHDHNRDYNREDKSIYNAVREIKNLAQINKIVYAFDFHSPWHIGGRNDKIFIVQKDKANIPIYEKFGKLFENENNNNSMQYKQSDDIAPGVEWNKTENGMDNTFSSYFSRLDSNKLAFTLENTYFGSPEDAVSQDKLIETGRCFARALIKYIKGAY